MGIPYSSSRRIEGMKTLWVIRMVLGLACLILLVCSSALAQEPEKAEKPWTGKLADGRVITKADLDHILQDHNLWLESKGKKGKKADLRRANLKRLELEEESYLDDANLSEANLESAFLAVVYLHSVNLSGANLTGAFLYNARLKGANLSGARIRKANLSADLRGANLSGADLWETNLSKADLTEANLIGADLRHADLSGAIFEPKPGSLPGVIGLSGIKGVDSLKYYGTNPYALVELREIFKRAGMREEERQVTYALNHNRRLNAWEEKKENRKIGWVTREIARVENVFQLLFFEWTCDYGMTPSRPLLIMFLGLFVFTVPYLLVFRSRDRKLGIWLVLPKDESSKKQFFRLTHHTPFRPLPSGIWARFKRRLSRGFRLVRLAFYFSLLSAFNLGWRELNVGNWISRLQKRDYTLQAKGWGRTVAGFQSLLSVYLLALWVLTYFGRPFE
jgi:hypothetical protein